MAMQVELMDENKDSVVNSLQEIASVMCVFIARSSITMHSIKRGVCVTNYAFMTIRFVRPSD